MSQRVRIQNMVAQMHEKNLVLVNLLRDMVENEDECNFVLDEDENEFWRKLNDRAVRRNEIIAEMRYFLKVDALAKRVNA